MVETNLGELQSYMLKSWKIQSKAKMDDISGIILNPTYLPKKQNLPELFTYLRMSPSLHRLDR